VSESALLVTGANGRLGRSLIRAVAGRRPVRALVRSERAAASLRDLPGLEIRQVDWADADALAKAGSGAGDWVHLVGILKETRRARYIDAHERPARALAAAAAKAGARRIVAVSILGAEPSSPNACLASKGRADAELLAGAVPATVLHGAEDAVDPPRQSERHMPFFPAGTDRRVVPGGGHFLPREQPAAVAGAILAPLARTE
jgi:uncharacterized protein YbjT (DUF2867 family)